MRFKSPRKRKSLRVMPALVVVMGWERLTFSKRRPMTLWFSFFPPKTPGILRTVTGLWISPDSSSIHSLVALARP